MTTRPLTKAVVAGNAAHVAVELLAGVGLPGASVAGPARAAVGWAVGSGWLWRIAGRGRQRHDTALALFAALSLAAVTAHLTAWPRRRSRIGLPWLTDCEGLGQEIMPVYNPVLYATAAAAIGALLGEVRSAHPVAPASALCLIPLLQSLQHSEHERLKQQAAQQPGWWNRRLR